MISWPRFLIISRKPDFTIGRIDDVYLRRWYVIPRNRLFNIYLHHFLRSDDDRALHDHPWMNLSILLKGSYVEHFLDGEKRLRQPWRPWTFWRLTGRKATMAHRVELIDNRPVWTLFLTGKNIRTWGFHCPNGWIPWTQFVHVRDGGNEAGEGCGET